MTKSLAEQLALLSDEDRAAALDGLDPEATLWDPKVWLRPEQMAPPDPWRVFGIVSGRGFGKDSAYGTPVPTPCGWRLIEDLAPGDQVFTHDGSLTTIVKTQDHVLRELYRVTFNDGSSLVTSATHEWTVLRGKSVGHYARANDVRDPSALAGWPLWRREPAATKGAAKRIRNVGAVTVETQQLRIGDHLPAAGPLQLPEADLPIDPYLLGLWLGDGFTGSGAICGAPPDLEFYLDELTRRGVVDDWVPVDMDTRCGKISSSTFHHQLLVAGLRPGKKTVPQVYLRGSVQQRLDLVRGLLDTDGHVTKAGNHLGAGFVNEEIADALEELALSLGWIVRRRVRVLKATELRPERPFFGVSWTPIGMNPFSLPRKSERVRDCPRNQATRKTMRIVRSVTPAGVGPTRCLAVTASSHLFLAGRGMLPTHNTRAGAEWIRQKAKEQPGTRFFLVARTSADVRDTMVNGESGILNVHPPSERPEWKPSSRMLIWPNKSTALCFSAEEPNQLRGPQAHYAWCDELAAWSFKPDDVGLHAWSNVNIATRLVPPTGAPQIMFTTTPKLVPDESVVALLKGEVPNTIITRGSIYDNSSNLSQEYLDFITGLYGGTRLGRQELEGLLLDRSEGALWTREMIHGPRMGSFPPLPLRVVAVDPSVAERPRDECGIVVIGATNERDLNERHAWVLEDATVHGSPDTWARAVISAARRWKAPIVAEGNQGAALVKLTLQNIDPRIPVFMVTAQQNKHTRAEAVVGAYEQGRVHHVGVFPDLESQLMTWVPQDAKSPDRLDALVWGVTACLVKPPDGLGWGPIRAKSPANRTMPLEPRAGSRGARAIAPGTTGRPGRGARVIFPR